jgi:rubrerythrin
VDKQTRDNLATAMRSEAFTYAKYMLFAEHARETGNPELAQLLEKTAKQELLEHFVEEAALAEVVRSDVDNLEDAIASESYGIESMYRDFAEQAFSAGDKAIGDRFEKIRHEEMKHRDAFKEALSKLAKKPLRAW